MTAQLVIAVLAVAAWLLGPLSAAGQNRGAPPAAPSARAAAPVDFTGYWVAFVTEDWRFRMVTPNRGDYQGVPLTPEARAIADAWNPAADAAAGNSCKAYGAAAIMRVPGRLRVTWQDDGTMRIDTDAGTQTRLFRFSPAQGKPNEPSWQGDSSALWERPAPPRGGAADAVPPGGSLKVVTTNMRAGYLRRNGVPYSEKAVLTEHFDLAPLPGGGQLMVVTAVVEDPQYLQVPFIVSSQFKKEADGSKWDPTPCTTNW